jgi:hypothetical protein
MDCARVDRGAAFTSNLGFASKVVKLFFRLCHRMCGGGYAPPIAARLFGGLCPWFGLSPLIYWAKGRTKGIARNERAVVRRGIATASHQAAKPKPDQRVTFRAKLPTFELSIKLRNTLHAPRSDELLGRAQ